MVSYALQSDLGEFFSSAEILIAADRDGDGTADTNAIEAAIIAASEEIDGYLGVRFPLPLAEVPSVLTRKCADIAMYFLSVTSTSMTEQKETQYNNAIKWLKDLSKGVVSLGIAEEQVAKQDSVVLGPANETRRFTRTKLAGLL